MRRGRRGTESATGLPAVLATLVTLALAGCEPDRTVVTQTRGVATGDWPAITGRGTIRFARRAWSGFETLPSQGLSTEQYQRLAERFASRHGLAAEWIVASDVDGLLRSVEEGRADVAVSNLTVTEPRSDRVAFSVPLTRSREWVIGSTEQGTFGVAEDTAYVESLARYYPGSPRVPVPAETDPIGFQSLLETGVIDATIMDEAAARVIVATSDRVDKLRELPEVKDHAWVLRKENPILKRTLDRYLVERHTIEEHTEECRDWDAIVAAGRLRTLTVNAPVTYYLWQGELLGFEYELVQSFADTHDLELEVIVAPGISGLIEGLAACRGDMIAAGLVPTDSRVELGLRFTRPYLHIHEVFVTAGEPILDLAGLAGRRIAVNPRTSYAATLKDLGPGAGFEVEFVDRSTSAILADVSAGRLDATLADSHRAELESAFDPRLSLGLALPPEKGLAWAVREVDEELLRRLDGFVRQHYRGYEFNVLRNKYFVNQRRMAKQREHRITGDMLSPYDDFVRPVAEAAGFDWRLIVAQMYQESGFDPSRVSFAGAQGLLQVLPRTARDLGVDAARLKDPETGIAAGVAYLRWTRERFPDLPVGEQTLFALGAYNAGHGHIRDGRRLARQLGLDGSLWFDNVEQAMLKLAEPEYAEQSVYGYVRGTEVVRYVREIRDRYRLYVRHFRLLEQREAPASDSMPPS
ncbi:MAG: transporter substrate-binding domain-containing protein [Gammaproteobacteria bacterium]|nr:transporter substrate-binding domain-containing protein [Gammaproteobacteria bacterium]